MLQAFLKKSVFPLYFNDRLDLLKDFHPRRLNGLFQKLNSGHDACER